MAKSLQPQEQILEAYSIIIDTIKEKKTHQYYKRTIELATLYKQLITGENTDSLLKQFVRREDDALFNQRKTLTSLITPAVCETIMTPFYRVGRTNNIQSKIDFKTTENNTEKLERVKKAIQEYNGNKTLSEYLDTRLVDLNFSDPNSFIVTEFDNVPMDANGKMEYAPSPRPFEVYSENAINYHYKNNILQWLIVRLPVTYFDNKGKECDGYSYTIYFPDIAIKFTQIDLTSETISKDQLIEYETEYGTKKYYRTDNDTLFEVEEYEYNAGKVPAARVGYKLDKATNGKTMVSPLHPALPYFMKSIKTVSEFDLTMALHAFPQKFQYVNKCPGTSSVSCDKGYAPDGTNCGVCKGTGIAIHSSTQDSIVLRLPNEPDQMIDLQKMVHYETPPTDIIKFQYEVINSLEEKAKKAIFTSTNINQSTATKTATELDYAYEDTYDTLFPYAKNYSEVYKTIANVSAAFVDVKDIIVEYTFPKDFKFKSVDDLLNELKVANESSAPGYIKHEISIDIAARQFLDKPEELKRIVSKQQFYPFPDKNFTEISFIISNDLTSAYNKFLYANFDSLFMKLERDAEEKMKYFYDYAPKKQKELLDAAVDEMIISIQEENNPAIGFKEAGQQENETKINDVPPGSTIA